MKTITSLKSLTYLTAVAIMFLASCKDNNTIDFNSTDAANLEGETTSDSYSSDAQDVSTDAVGGMTDVQLSGRSETASVVVFPDNDRLKCATVTVTPGPNSTKDAPNGTITIAFPNDGSCADARGIVRKGTINIAYTGKRFVPGSVITTTFTNYFVSGIKVEGTHTLTNIAATNTSFPKFNVVIAGGKLTFPSGQTITREQDFTREWQRATSPVNDKWVLSAGGTASGSNRNGKVYSMSITKDLVYSRSCQINNKVFIAVSGEKVFTSESKTLTVSYGDGTCDNIVTITINGKTRDVTIKGDGN